MFYQNLKNSDKVHFCFTCYVNTHFVTDLVTPDMYDTVNMVLRREDARGTDFVRVIPAKLTRIKENYDRETNVLSLTGNLGNYKVELSEASIKLFGSLNKFHFGNQWTSLNWTEAKFALMNLSDQLHLPLHHAKIIRLDVAENLKVDFRPLSYYPLLMQTKGFNRLEQNNGIYYVNSKRTLTFYDKVKEQKSKRQLIPCPIKVLNLLRCELRNSRSLPKHLNLPEVNGECLMNEKFYKHLVKTWGEEYKKINKQKIILPFILSKDNPLTQLALIGANSLGGEGEVIKMIDQSANLGCFDNRMQKSRLKSIVKRLYQSPKNTIESDLITELNKKIQDTVAREAA